MAGTQCPARVTTRREDRGQRMGYGSIRGREGIESKGTPKWRNGRRAGLKNCFVAALGCFQASWGWRRWRLCACGCLRVSWSVVVSPVVPASNPASIIAYSVSYVPVVGLCTKSHFNAQSLVQGSFFMSLGSLISCRCRPARGPSSGNGMVSGRRFLRHGPVSRR